MPRNARYDNGFGGYDRELRRRPPGYDADVRFDPWRATHGDPWPYDATGWAPYTFAPLGFDPALGWAGWGPGTGFVGWARARAESARRDRPPRGRGRYGYDFEMRNRPRRDPWER